MSDLHEALRDDVRALGGSLGQTIENHLGSGFLERVERVRKLAKAGRHGTEEDRESLLEELRSLSEDEMLPVARAFTQFLNLANIAEEHTGCGATKRFVIWSPPTRLFSYSST